MIHKGFQTDKEVGEKIEKALGKIVLFDSPVADWHLPKEQTTPMGSEGGIHYQYITLEKEDSGSMCRGVVLITGSLRDYGEDDYKEIQAWLNKAFEHDPTYKKGYFVRQGVVELQIEGVKNVYLVWDDKKHTFQEGRISYST